MEALFKRHFWIVKVLGIGAAAGLAASASITQLGSSALLDVTEASDEAGDTDGADAGDDDEDKLDPDNPFKPRPTVAKVGGSRAGKDRAASTLKKHNVFCPTCLPPEPEPGSPGATGATGPMKYDAEGRPIGPVIQPGEVRSSLPLLLQATMESVDDPEMSLATVFDTQTGTVGLFGIDDVIQPGVVVTGIDQGMLHLRHNAALEYIELGAVPPEQPVKPATEEKKEDEKTEEKKDDRNIPGAEEAINCPNENLCIVERAFVESLISNPMALAKQARIVPAKDGEVGFKFYGIRKGSLPKLLGLKNGDKLVAVNGEEMTGIDQAMGLYTKLRRASNLQVTIERKGKTLNKEIQIQ